MVDDPRETACFQRARWGRWLEIARVNRSFVAKAVYEQTNDTVAEGIFNGLHGLEIEQVIGGIGLENVGAFVTIWPKVCHGVSRVYCGGLLKRGYWRLK